MDDDNNVGKQEPRSGWANTIASGNSFRMISPEINATGFQTNELKYRTISHLNHSSSAEEFLVNSRLRRGDWETEASILAYFTDPAQKLLSLRGNNGTVEHREAFALPEGVELGMGLDAALSRRRSARQYTGDTMSLDYLATLLRAGTGNSGVAEPTLGNGETIRLDFRTHASAGGLFPIDLYVLVNGVDGLTRGIYRYDPSGHVLYAEDGPEAVEAGFDCFAVNEKSISVRRSSIVLLFVAQPWRMMRKYGTRGMRFVFMETGAIAQNIALAVTALGFGAVECASVYDDELHDVLGIDGNFRALTHAMVVGCIG